MKPINLIIGLLSLAYASINAHAQSANDTVKVFYKGKVYKTTTKRDAEEEERSKTWKFRDTVKKEMVLIKVLIKDDDGENWDTQATSVGHDSSIKLQWGNFKKKISSDDKLVKTYFVPTIEFGFVSTIKENNIEDNLDPVFGKSWFSNVNWIRQTVNLSHNKFFLSYGLNQNSYSINYNNKQQVQYIDNNGYLKTNIDTVNHYKRNRLTASYIAIPVLLEYHSKNNKFKIAAGAEFAFNGKTSVYQKGNRKEGDFIQTNKYDLKLNPTQVNALLKVEIEHLGIYARYSVTEMYKSSAYAPDTNPQHHLFSVGICLFGI